MFVEIEGFFNLLFSHFLTLSPLDAPETKAQLTAVLTLITSSNEQAAVKYRMYEKVHPCAHEHH